MKLIGMHNLVNHIIDALFISDKRRLTEWVDRIVKQNQECHNHSDNAFIYNGQFFRASYVCGKIPKRANLHSSLVPDMNALLKDRKIVDDQKTFVRQIIVQLLDPCENTQDIRDALPDCLSNCISDCVHIPRTRPAAYTLQNNPRALKQYNEMFPQIQTYSALRLI